MRLQRTLGTTTLFLMALGGMVGSGWLFGPYYAAQIAGPAAILSWLLGGILILIIAFTFSELAAMLPVTGGMVRFGEISHGPIVGFIITWISWLCAVCVAPLETLAILQYSSQFFPWLLAKSGAHYTLTTPGLIVATGVMLSMCILNALGAKIFAKTNNTIVIWKLAVPLITIAFFVTHTFHTENFYQYGGFFPNDVQSMLKALPTAGIIMSFIGFSPAIMLAGEAKNPQRALPIALIGSISCCCLLYVVIQIAFIGAIDSTMLENGWKMLSFSGDAGPFAGMAMTLGMAWLVKLLYFDAIISPYGTAFTYTNATARINYAAVENGYFPAIFQRLNRQGVPHVAIGVNFIIGLILFLPFPGWQDMVEFIVTSFVIVYAIGPIALISLRKTLPNKERPFRLPAANIMAPLAFYVCNLMLLWTGWHTISRLMIIICIGFVYLAFYLQTKAGKKIQLQWKSSYWLAPHFIGISVISYLSTFGEGRGILPFGWDMVVTGLFSMVVFHMATREAFLRPPVFTPEQLAAASVGMPQKAVE